jgi:PHD/YefM family antitoxin component YafN of YafNO toxin-antitoxin module
MGLYERLMEEREKEERRSPGTFYALASGVSEDDSRHLVE